MGQQLHHQRCLPTLRIPYLSESCRLPLLPVHPSALQPPARQLSLSPLTAETGRWCSSMQQDRPAAALFVLVSWAQEQGRYQECLKSTGTAWGIVP